MSAACVMGTVTYTDMPAEHAASQPPCVRMRSSLSAWQMPTPTPTSPLLARSARVEVAPVRSFVARGDRADACPPCRLRGEVVGSANATARSAFVRLKACWLPRLPPLFAFSLCRLPSC